MTLTVPSKSASTETLQVISVAAAAILLYLVITFGMLPGLLALCAGYLLARWLASGKLMKRFGRRGEKISATLVGLLPFVAVAGIVVGAGNAIGDLRGEFSGLSMKVTSIVSDWRTMLPPELAAKLPSNSGVHEILVAQLKERSGMLASVGKLWLGGLLQVVVGTLVGVLLFLDTSPRTCGLSKAIQARGQIFIGTFRNIVTAQFVIALVNTFFTALYLFVVLPLFDIKMPYALALTVLTFVAGLFPIVGNLLCNVVLTLVSLSVSPGVALASLGFLIAVHKTEYAINAAVVGGKTNISVWEMLLAIFIGELLFGVAGLVAAPLFYAYFKQEIKLIPYLRDRADEA